MKLFKSNRVKQPKMMNENKNLVINELSENELLIRYRNGDEDAFREVVTRYKKPLYTFLRRFTNDLRVAEDVFQEAFLQLYSSQDRFDTNRPLRPWLFSIAANKANDALQKMQRQSTISMSTFSDEDGYLKKL